MSRTPINIKRFATIYLIFPYNPRAPQQGQVQLTFLHASVGNKYLEESVAVFDLTGSIDSPSISLIDININFATDGDKILLTITEVLLYAAAGDLKRSKKQQDWMPRNAVLLPTFLTEAEILDGGTDAGELLKIFACSVTERAEEGGEDGGDNDEDEHDIEGDEESEEDNKKNTKKRIRPPPRR